MGKSAAARMDLIRVMDLLQTHVTPAPRSAQLQVPVRSRMPGLVR
jgi:hypothetical protein